MATRVRKREGAIFVEMDQVCRDRLDKLCGMFSVQYGMDCSMADVVRILIRDEFNRRIKKSQK